MTGVETVSAQADKLGVQLKMLVLLFPAVVQPVMDVETALRLFLELLGVLQQRNVLMFLLNAFITMMDVEIVLATQDLLGVLKVINALLSLHVA